MLPLGANSQNLLRWPKTVSWTFEDGDMSFRTSLSSYSKDWRQLFHFDALPAELRLLDVVCVGCRFRKNRDPWPNWHPIEETGPTSITIRLSLLHKMPSSSFIYPSSYELLHLLQSKWTIANISFLTPLTFQSLRFTILVNCKSSSLAMAAISSHGLDTFVEGLRNNITTVECWTNSNYSIKQYHISKPITKEKMIHARVWGTFLFFLNWSMVRRLEWNTVRIGEMVSLTSNHSP